MDGRMISKLHDFTVSRFHDFQISKLHDFQVSKLQDFQVSKLHDFQVSKLHDFQVSKLHNFQVSRFHDFKVSKFLNFKNMNTPKVYIAGPISGHKDFNIDAFQRMEFNLLTSGFDTRNPHAFCEHIQSDDPSDPRYYAEGIRQLTECTDIILLDGWQYSTGAQVEVKVAQLLRLGVHEDIESLIKKYTA